jgi:hypothetical protein
VPGTSPSTSRLDQSAHADDLKRVLLSAREAIEKLALPAGDKDEVTGDLGKLTEELGKPVLEPSRLARYLAHIREVAPRAEEILTANERILTGKVMEALRDALCAAFDQNSFDQMLRLRLNKDRGQLVAADGFRTVVFKVIDVAHREGWVPDLVTAAAGDKPGNPTLKKFCAEHPHLVRTGAK